MNKKQKKIVDEFKESDFDEKEGMPIETKIVAAIIFIAICCAITISVLPKEALINGTIINQTCPICNDHSNFTTYTIPAERPNVSKIVKDPLCNDFCYLEACHYGCSIWINLGLADGRCECELQQCVIKTRDEFYG